MVVCLKCKTNYIFFQKSNITDFICNICKNNKTLQILSITYNSCVSYPPLQSIDNFDDMRCIEGISKYTTLKMAKHELDIYKKLDIIDSDYIFHLHKPLLSKPLYIPSIFYNKFNNENNPALLIYEHGGMTLHNLVNKRLLDINKCIKGILGLFNTIYILNKNNIIHGDIKFENIICYDNIKNYHYILIDFGLSRLKSNKSVIRYDKLYLIWSWERKLLDDTKTKNDIYKHIETFLKKTHKYLPKTYTKKNLIQIYEELNKMDRNELKKLINSKIDLYSIGFIFYNYMVKKKDTIMTFFMEKLICPDIRLRYNNSQVLYYFYILLAERYPHNTFPYYEKKLKEYNIIN